MRQPDGVAQCNGMRYMFICSLKEAADMNDTSPMPRPPSDAVQIAIRVPQEWLARADKLIPSVARPGVQATRTDVFRAAIASGLSALEADIRDEKRRQDRHADRRLARADTLARLAGVRGLTVRYDAPKDALVITDGRVTRTSDVAMEDDTIICNWPGAKLDCCRGTRPS